MPIGRLVVVGVLLWFSMASQSTSSAPKPIDDVDSYAVYGVVMATEWTVRVGHATTLVVSERAEKGPDCNRRPLPSSVVPPPPPAKWRDAFADYEKQNAEPRAIRPGFSIGLPYIVVTKDDVDKAFARRDTMSFGWDNFSRAYPDSGHSLVSFSAVGFDDKHAYAKVAVGHSCGSLCGEMGYHFLEKRDGVWLEVPAPVPVCFIVS